jgi:hypothetical protein
VGVGLGLGLGLGLGVGARVWGGVRVRHLGEPLPYTPLVCLSPAPGVEATAGQLLGALHFAHREKRGLSQG